MLLKKGKMFDLSKPDHSIFESKKLDLYSPVNYSGLEKSVSNLVAEGPSRTVLTSSGTAAIHTLIVSAGLDSNCIILCPSSTFGATVFPFLERSIPVYFYDLEIPSLSPAVASLNQCLSSISIEEKLDSRTRIVLVVVDNYGADCLPGHVREWAYHNSVSIIVDAAESLGKRPCRSDSNILGIVTSFNGNKIISGFGGGALTLFDETTERIARSYIDQGKVEGAAGYAYKLVGNNLRINPMSAILISQQISDIKYLVNLRTERFKSYLGLFNDNGLEFESVGGKDNTHWLSVFLITGQSRDRLTKALANIDAEFRYCWRPLYKSDPFFHCRTADVKGSERLFTEGICLPSGRGIENLYFQRLADELAS